MESLARFLVAVTGLFEAEGLALKRQLVRLVVAAGLGLLILGLVVAGLCLLLCGLFMALAGPLRPAGATVVVGVVAMFVALGVLFSVRRLLKPSTTMVTKPARASVPEAKADLMDAARPIDLLTPIMRRRPFTSVGVAAGIGAVLGMGSGRPIARARLTRAIVGLFLRE